MGEATMYKYPRRRAVRTVLRAATAGLVHALSKARIIGAEHVPRTGPVILAANHFTFVDAPLLLFASPRLVEFIGGADRVNSPLWSRFIPHMWGYIPAYRGAFTRSTIRGSLEVLGQGGVMGIFPEGGNWAGLLRPARPGLGFLAAESGAPVVAVSISGAEHVLGKGRHPLTITFQAPLPAPEIIARGRVRRAALDQYGASVMARIARGLPDPLRGAYSASPEARAAAAAVSAYP
ncbi:MAG: lysophospholipid acyltransferase family protein, partial [Pseudomonadota bacterium]